MGLSPFRVLSVCSGGAGLDRGLRRAEPTARTIGYVEVEAFACSVLVAQMEARALDPAPIWTDARTFDGRAWRGAVDCVVAGFPCQDISSAGKRAGIRGERSGLWFEVARIVRDVGARYVFLENVDALLVRGIDTVLGSLAEMGFAAQWGIFSAAEAGAPHLRERWFCVAVAQPESGGQRVMRESSGSRGQPDGDRQAVDDTDTRRRRRAGDAIRPGRDRPGRTGTDVGDADRGGRGGRLTPTDERADAAGSRRGVEGSSICLADADTGRFGAGVGAVCGRQPDITRSSEPLGSPNGSRLAGGTRERSRWATAEASAVLADGDSEGCCREWRESSDDRDSWGHVDGRERPSTVLAEFPPDRADMRAWAEVQAGFEPAICRLADGLDMGLRTDWLRLLGNGVVPQQAEHAYRTLRGRLMAEGLWP